MTRVPVSFPHYGGEKSGYAVVLMEPRSGIAVGLHHHDGNPGQPFDESCTAWTTCRSGSLAALISTRGKLAR